VDYPGEELIGWGI